MPRKRVEPSIYSLSRKIWVFLYPGTLFFVIFWFPIVLPLLVNLIASTIELAAQVSQVDEFSRSAIWNQDFLFLVFKNSYLAFVSTDIWALTTTLVYSAKGRLNGLRAWVYGCAAIIALFLHIFFYSATILISKYEGDLWIAVLLFFSGCISVFWLRLVIFHSIEKVLDLPELASRGND